MVDKAEKVGRKACESLQSEFAKNSVIFQRTDVTNKRELVRTVPLAYYSYV